MIKVAYATLAVELLSTTGGLASRPCMTSHHIVMLHREEYGVNQNNNSVVSFLNNLTYPSSLQSISSDC